MDKFESYVGRYNPDLLIIGGISQKNDIEAIGKVIDLASRKIGCEILLLSGAYARDTRAYDINNPSRMLNVQKWKLSDEFSKITIMRQSDNYSVKHQTPPSSELKKIATDKGVAFIDMTTPTYKYVYTSGKPYEFFNRDRVHSNILGKQINGRILYRLFMNMAK